MRADGEREEGVELLERLRVDECADLVGRGDVGIGLAHPVHHDPIAREAGLLGEGQLDRVHHLGPGADGREAAEEPRIGVGLDRVRDEGAGKGGLELGEVLGSGVHVCDVQRRAPAGRGRPELIRAV